MTTANINRYAPSVGWIYYDKANILDQLVEAKTAAGVLRQLSELSRLLSRKS